MSESTETHPFSPGIMSVLPMFYVGWSDSVLSPSEINLIHERVDQLNFMTYADKKYIIKYTDPKNPPDKTTFQAWVTSLKKRASSLDESQKNSLAMIGLEIAKSAISYQQEEIFNSPNTINALKDIEEALGLDSESSLKLLLDKIESQPEKDCVVCTFQSEDLRDYLDGEQKEINNRVRKLIRDPFFKFEHIADKEIYRQKVLEQTKAMAAQGFGAYAFPKEYGGYDRVRDHIAVFEQLAYNDNSLTIKYGVQFGLFGGAVYGLGTEKHHKKYLEALSRAELLGCFAMTETGHGSNVKGLKTTATYNPSDGSITIHTPTRSDGKEYIGNALHSTMAAVFAQLIVDGDNHGVHCILVPLRDENHKLLSGVLVEDNGYKLGLNGVDNGRIWFKNVKVPSENLLDRFGQIDADGKYQSKIENPNRRFFTMLGALVAGRVCVGLGGLSVAKTSLAIATKYALRRRQFGAKDNEAEMLLMDYPTHQRRLIPLIAKSYAYHFALYTLADRFTAADENDQRKLETDAAGLKSLVTWYATKTVQECREACGGKGYLAENRFANLKGDSEIFTTFEGDNTVLMQLVAKGALTEYKQSFHDDGIKAVMRYLGNRIGNTMSELNPISARNTSREHLLDRDFHRDAFRYREKKLLLTLSQRMQDYIKKRIRPFDAFLKCQTHMIALAKAYTERYALREFRLAIERCDHPEVKAILNKLCDLYCLTILEENKGWFLENDYMEGQKTKAIRRVVTKLCQDIRPEVESLVDAYGISEEVLAAPIVLDIER